MHTGKNIPIIDLETTLDKALIEVGKRSWNNSSC